MANKKKTNAPLDIKKSNTPLDIKKTNTPLDFIKQYGRIFIEAIVVLGVVLTLLQLNLQQKQFAYDLSRTPALVYSYDLVVKDSNPPAIPQAQDRLIEKYYTLLNETTQANSGLSYKDASNRILPIEEPVSSQPVSLIINITNNGIGTATQVRTKITINRLISSVNISALEPAKIIDGGEGDNFATIEVDRIVQNDTAVITVESDDLTPGTQPAKLILQNPPLGISRYLGTTRFLGQSFYFINGGFLLPDQRFPLMTYVNSSSTDVTVRVTSAEGLATRKGDVYPTATRP